MNPETPIALRIVLGFLKAGRVLDGGSSVLLLSTMLFVFAPASVPTTVSIEVGLGLGMVEKYFAWRIALDVEFFALLEEQPQQAAAFDAALAAFVGRAVSPTTRTMESRWRGARRLMCYQAAALAWQAVVVGALVVLAYQASGR